MPRSGSEVKTTLFASDSECQAGRLTERHLRSHREILGNLITRMDLSVTLKEYH